MLDARIFIDSDSGGLKKKQLKNQSKDKCCTHLCK